MVDMLCTWVLAFWGTALYQSTETSGIQIINEERNWWKAQSRCKENERKLYTPGSDDIPEEIWISLRSSTYYWIGAMSYRAWLWTVDDSPLFTYAGFLPLARVVGQPKRTYLKNSVWKCHLHCSPTYSVGMKGTTCYCLEEGYNTINTSTPEVTCPGNLEERCGNSQGMSVYKLENLTFYQEKEAYCAYAGDTDLSIETSTLDRCREKDDCYACFALSGATISCTPEKSWFDAENACDLVKLNTSARTSLLRSYSTTTTFWIGLHKVWHRKWLNGASALKYGGYSGVSSSDTWCLAVYKTWFGWKSLYWRSCSEKRNFICEDARCNQGGITIDRPRRGRPPQPEIGTSGYYSDRTTTVREQQQGCLFFGGYPVKMYGTVNRSTSSTTIASTSSPHFSSSATTSTTATIQPITVSTKRNPASSPRSSPSGTQAQPSESVATTDSTNSTDIGTPAAGRKDAREPSANSATGIFIGLGVGCVLLVLTVLVVVYLLRSFRQKKKRDGNQPVHFTSAAENIYCGLVTHAQTDSEAYAVITPPDAATDETQASSTAPVAIVRPSVHSDTISINTSQINDENEYNVLSTPRVPVSHGNPYNHLSGPDRGNKGDYDTANFVPQTEEISRGQVFEEEQYNVLGQHDSPKTVGAVAGVYDHVAADKGEYDTARWGKNASEVDDSYNHIQRTTKPCRGDTYDVTSKGQSGGCADDTCTDDVMVVDGRGDTPDYCNTGCLLPDNGSVEEHKEGDDESDRRGQENVYSLAKDITDA